MIWLSRPISIVITGRVMNEGDLEKASLNYSSRAQGEA